jgi:hypothetical protein
MDSMIKLGIELVIPFLFVVSAKPIFGWGAIARVTWLLLGLLAVFALWQPTEYVVLMLPAVHLALYHLMRRITFGSWAASPALVVFDFRPTAGTQKERWFGVAFVMATLIVSAVLA